MAKPFDGNANSVYITGFRKEIVDKDIFEELVKAGLPGDHSSSETNRNRKNGKVYIYNLRPEVTIELSKNLNGKKLLGGNIMVTPIMAMSPTKSTPLSRAEDSSKSNDSVPPLVNSDGSDSDSDDEEEVVEVETIEKEAPQDND